jgi:TonB family protein
MPPIIKDSDAAPVSQETTRSGSAATAGDAAAKPQPVALEVPITVNGVRTVAGSDKREPFSESTKTVMIHGVGAVIRLNSSVAPGQLLFLTNERTKKEVVCQVVKSKTYRNVSGYVELEFTEPAVGFWGMRFPSDRIGPGPQAVTGVVRPPAAGHGAPSRPVAQKTEPPMASVPASAPAKPSSPAPAPSKLVPPSTAPSIVPAPIDSAALLGAPKEKANSAVPAAPAVRLLDADEPLIEPWLRKREPAPRPPVAPPTVASAELAAKSEEPARNLTSPARNFDLSRSSDKPASLFAPSAAPANLSTVDLSSLTPFFEVKRAPADATPRPAPAAPDAETEELQQHTARLQEELSKIPFAEEAFSPTERTSAARACSPRAPEAEAPAFPLTEQSIAALKMELKTDMVHESAVRLVESDEPSQKAPVLPEAPKREEPLKIEPPAPIPALDTLGQEEMKIPAWLEPLARNASSPSSIEELVQREKTKRTAEQPALEELIAPLAAPAPEGPVSESRVPQFGSALPFEEASRPRDTWSKESTRKKPGKGMLLAGLAAGIVVLAGGWWYMNRQSAGVHAGLRRGQGPASSPELETGAAKESVLGTALPGRTDLAAEESRPLTGNSNDPVHPGNNLSGAAPESAPAGAARNARVSSESSKGASAASAPTEAEPVEAKKPILGEVHLAAPKISQKRNNQSGAEPDAAVLNEDQPESNADSLGTGLGIASNQPAAPAAPLTVGGDVETAKLISSVPPVYPAMARAQHISGGVTIDALIDANGRVSTMKIVSGPTLLRQAAVDALKQWKYQPATLDGKAVPLHLMVTIQFKLQQ